MDPLDPGTRSALMARIGSQATAPELIVRSVLRELGHKFRTNVSELPGTPDIVLDETHLVVFVHGCFWHRHPRCALAYSPKTRAEFWQKKFTSNIARDRRVTRELRDRGWHVSTLWECQLADRPRVRHRLQRALRAATARPPVHRGPR